MSFHVLKHMFTRCLGVLACIVVLITTISAHAQTSSVYWTNAQNTHNFVYATLLTSYNSYRIEPGSSTTHEWYNVSQIYADTALYKEGDTRYAPYVNNTYSFMNHMWANTRVGGYYAAANIDGTGAAGDQYVDDNSLAGNVYLDAYEATLQQAAYLASAEAIANWLMYSGLWDNTYGGGFWWSTQKQVKPTQSNGLALQLFIRLYKITGQSYYQSWATSIKNWLESQMYGSNGLYIWEINSTQGGAKQTENFTYDNAIMIEADLLWASVMGDNSYVTKAQNLGIALNTVLWDPTYRVYHFISNSTRVNPAWCVWASQAMIRLYERDRNTAWLDYAQQNIDFMNKNLLNSANGGYKQWVNVDGTERSSTNEAVDQAWMERTQALLALYR